jgi:hypothetical protein
MRVEHFWPAMAFNETQFYVNCAHIEVVGPGGGMSFSVCGINNESVCLSLR